MGLNFKANSKSRKLPTRKRILEIAKNSNQIWSLDFMSGKINNRRFRTLNVIDEHAREYLDIKALRSIPSNLVINVLNQIISDNNRKPIALMLLKETTEDWLIEYNYKRPHCHQRYF